MWLPSRPIRQSLMHSAARPLRFGSLRTRLLWLVLVSMLPVLGLTLYQAHCDYQKTRTDVQTETLDNARLVANHIGLLLGDTRDVLGRVSRLYTRRLRRNINIDRDLAELVKEHALYTTLTIVDPRGNVVVSSTPFTAPVSVTDRPWFRDLLQTQKFSVGDFQVGRLTGRAVLIAALPITDSETKELVGIAAASLDLEQIQSTLKRFTITDGNPTSVGGTVTSLTDRKGTILARYPLRNELVGRTLHDASLIEGVLSKAEGFAVGEGPDGETCIYAFVQIGGTRGHLYIVTSVPTGSAYADVRQALIINLFWLMMVVLLALVLAWSVGTVFILHPIHALNQLAARLTGGDLAARSGVAVGVGELHDLALTIDRMAETLEKRETDRQRAADELSKSEEKYREIFELSPEAIVLLDADGRILDVNDRMQEWLGYDRADILGKGLLEANVVAAECRPTMMNALRKRLAGEAVPPYELQFLTGDGKTRTGRVIGTPLLENGAVVGDLVMISDITEAKVAEQRMLALEKSAQQAGKLESLRVMAAGIAHDFNNLLQAIIGNAELAEQTLPPTAAPQAELREIQRAAVRATRLTHQMLDYAGSGTIHTEPLRVSSFIAARRDTFTAVVNPGVHLNLILAPELPAIKANQAQIEQAVLNLVLNASEAIGDGHRGTVTITTGRQEVDEVYLHDAVLGEGRSQGEYVFIEVADSGCGMPETVRPRLFEPFFSTKFTGRGLGLASVLGITRGHRGIIKVRTQPGSGSSFRLLFPAVADAPGANTSAATPRETTVLLAGGVTAAVPTAMPLVLVVDDEDGLCVMAKQILERAGFRVLTAGSGRAAIELIQSHGAQIGLVILDHTMPGMDGTETCQALRRLRPDVRVVISSGFSEEQVRIQGNGDGISGFLQKPYTVETLLSTVRKYLRIAPA